MPIQFNQLCLQVGVDGFFCIVRNTVDFRMTPVFYFTRPDIEEYMPIAIGRLWDTYAVGSRIEAFVLAGCSLKGGKSLKYYKK